jgi:hypothetical protein
MRTAHETIHRLHKALNDSLLGHMSQQDMIGLWRQDAATLPLPERFAQVLGTLLDRLEASALFSEESCSFSQKDLLDHLKIWLQKAEQNLA